MTDLPHYALRYLCGHLCDGDDGTPLALIPLGWHVKPIDGECTACREAKGPVKRLPPFDWGDETWL